LIPLERTAEIFSDLFNVLLSEGTIVKASARSGEALNGFSEWNIERIMKSRVVNFDETGINIEGSLHWINTAGTPLLQPILLINEEDRQLLMHSICYLVLQVERYMTIGRPILNIHAIMLYVMHIK